MHYIINLYLSIWGDTMSAEKLFTTETVARALLVKPDTLRGWLRTGKIKGVKVGRLWRIWKRDFEAFLSEDEGFHGDES